MRRIYLKPSIKVKKICTESPLAISVGGNAGIEQGGSSEEPPAHGSAKSSVFGTDEESASSSNIWSD